MLAIFKHFSFHVWGLIYLLTYFLLFTSFVHMMCWATKSREWVLEFYLFIYLFSGFVIFVVGTPHQDIM